MMRISFTLRMLAILSLVVASSPQSLAAQETDLPKISLPQLQAPPPLPPLPGMVAPPPPVAVEKTKLPQLKTIPEIPPAKQVADNGTADKGWMDKIKSWFARFEDKKAPAPQTTATVIKPSLKPLDEKPGTASVSGAAVVLPPPPPMEPPVLDALNLTSETPTVDPDIFAFDEAEKRKDEKKLAAKETPAPPVIATTPIPALKPLAVPPPPLPNAALSLPPLATTPVVPVLEKEKMPPLPKPEIAAPKVPPVVAETRIIEPAPEKSLFDSMKEAAKEASAALLGKNKTENKTAASAGWFDSLKEMATDEEEKPKVKFLQPKLDILAEKPPVPTPPTAPLPTAEPTVVPIVKTPAPPAIPKIEPLPTPMPAPEIAAAVETPEPPAPVAPPPAPVTTTIAKTPPPLPKIEMPVPTAAIMPPPAPVIPNIPAPKMPETSVVEAKTPPPVPAITPAVPASPPMAVPPLPALSLEDLKLPGDNEQPASIMPAVTPPATQEVVIPEAEIAAPEIEQPDAYEFSELEDQEKTTGEQGESENTIADISEDDPSFKFWKNHNFDTQVMPSVINRKEYATRNQHLPKAMYKEDLEQLLFVAAGRGDLNVVRALLNEGVDVEAKNAIGDTPLVHAALNGQAGAVRVLLARGANPNNPNVHGITAMQVAAERGREDIIDALFEMGAKATADYRNPMTPLQSGVTRGFASVYNAMLDGINPQKEKQEQRNRALQALADAGPAPRIVISNGPGLSKQIIDDQVRKKPGEPLTFEEIERKLAYQEYVRKTGDDPAANAMATGTTPKLISPAGVKATPVPIPYASPQPAQPRNPPPPPGYIPPQAQEPIIGLPQME